jgi:hypothetical protein
LQPNSPLSAPLFIPQPGEVVVLLAESLGDYHIVFNHCYNLSSSIPGFARPIRAGAVASGLYRVSEVYLDSIRGAPFSSVALPVIHVALRFLHPNGTSERYELDSDLDRAQDAAALSTVPQNILDLARHQLTAESDAMPARPLTISYHLPSPAAGQFVASQSDLTLDGQLPTIPMPLAPLSLVMEALHTITTLASDANTPIVLRGAAEPTATGHIDFILAATAIARNPALLKVAKTVPRLSDFKFHEEESSASDSPPSPPLSGPRRSGRIQATAAPLGAFDPDGNDGADASAEADSVSLATALLADVPRYHNVEWPFPPTALFPVGHIPFTAELPDAPLTSDAHNPRVHYSGARLLDPSQAARSVEILFSELTPVKATFVRADFIDGGSLPTLLSDLGRRLVVTVPGLDRPQLVSLVDARLAVGDGSYLAFRRAHACNAPCLPPPLSVPVAQRLFSTIASSVAAESQLPESLISIFYDDPVRTLAGYATVVPSRCHFRLLLARAALGAYRTPAAAADDVLNIGSNCQRFNPGSPELVSSTWEMLARLCTAFADDPVLSPAFTDSLAEIQSRLEALRTAEPEQIPAHDLPRKESVAVPAPVSSAPADAILSPSLDPDLPLSSNDDSGSEFDMETASRA